MSELLTLIKNPRREIEQLCKLEPLFIPLALKFSPFPLPMREFSFDLFVSSIIGQSISTKAAETIKVRIRTSINAGKPLTPEVLTEITPEQLRDLGLSNAKAGAIKSLTAMWVNENMERELWNSWSNKRFMDHFTQLPGIGPWTVKMVLIFGLRRADVFPEGDLAVRIGLQQLYNLPERPSQQEARAMSLAWQPFRTIGTVYLWQSLLTENSSSLSESSVWWAGQANDSKERP